MVSVHRVIFKPRASVECADGVATRSTASTVIESCPFKTFVMMLLFQTFACMIVHCSETRAYRLLPCEALTAHNWQKGKEYS